MIGGDISAGGIKNMYECVTGVKQGANRDQGRTMAFAARRPYERNAHGDECAGDVANKMGIERAKVGYLRQGEIPIPPFGLEEHPHAVGQTHHAEYREEFCFPRLLIFCIGRRVLSGHMNPDMAAKPIAVRMANTAYERNPAFCCALSETQIPHVKPKVNRPLAM